MEAFLDCQYLHKRKGIMVARFFLLAVAFSMIASYAGADGKIRGTFEVMGKLPAKNSMEKIVFEEFINFGCPHCNHFRLLSGEMKEKYKDRVEFVDVPILFRGQDDAPLRLYYVAKSLGKAEQVRDAIFEARFKYGVNVFDPGIINYLARSLGLGEAYKQNAQNGEISQAIAEGEQQSIRYNITATPTIVLAGTLKLRIGSSMEGFVESLPDTLDDLLKQN